MSNAAIITISIVVGLVVLVAILIFRRSLASVTLSLFGAKTEIKTHRPGASAVGAKAGRNLTVENTGSGAASADNAEAGQDISVTNRAEP